MILTIPGPGPAAPPVPSSVDLDATLPFGSSSESVAPGAPDSRLDSPFAENVPPPRPPGEPENPYQSPGDYGVSAGPDYGQAPFAIRPTEIAALDVFSRTWTIYRDRLGTCLWIFLAAGFVFFAAWFFLVIGMGVISVAALFGGFGGVAAAFVVRIAFQLAMFLFTTWIGIGLVIALLKIARGHQVSVGDLFRGGPYFVRVLLAQLLLMLLGMALVFLCAVVVAIVSLAVVVVAGRNVWPASMVLVAVTYVLALVPLIVLQLMFAFYQFLIVDRNAGILESLRFSVRLTSGNKLTMFVCFLVVGLVVVALAGTGIVLTALAAAAGGTLAAIGAGILLTMAGVVGLLLIVPYGGLLWSVMYLAASGQPTADRMRAEPVMV